MNRNAAALSSRRRGPLTTREQLEFAAFGALPLVVAAVTVYGLTLPVTAGWHQAVDFHTFWQGGRAYLSGRNPYPTATTVLHPPATQAGQFFDLPAWVAALFVPFALLPFAVAAACFLAVSAAAIMGALWLLGVRDWRCYGAAFAWPAVPTGVTIGTLTPLLVLAAAVLWHYRDHAWKPAIAAAFLVGAKLFLWPLLLWLAVTGRIRIAGRSVVLIAGASLLAWLPLGVHSFTAYVGMLSPLSRVEGPVSYQPAWLLPGPEPLLLGVSTVLLAAGFLAWRPAERIGFQAAVLWSLALSPILWAHFFALLIPVVALASPQMSWVWVVPLALWATSQQNSGGQAWRVAVVAGVICACTAATYWRHSRPVAADGLQVAVPASGSVPLSRRLIIKNGESAVGDSGSCVPQRRDCKNSQTCWRSHKH